MKIKFIKTVIMCIVLWACSPNAQSTMPNPYPTGDQTYLPSKVKKVLEKQQRAAFTFFYDGADKNSGMALEGNNRGNTITIGGSGFGVMALIVGVERGWISREQGLDRIEKILDFLSNADRYKGVWSHWHNPDGSYAAFGDQKATGDLVETSFMIQGLIAAREYFDKNNLREEKIRDSIDSLYDSVQWSSYTSPAKDGLYWLWYSEQDRYALKIQGWNEALVTYLLALGANDEYAIDTDIYEKGWAVKSYSDRVVNGYPFPLGSSEEGGPLFFSHYSFLGFNPKEMQDGKAWYWQQNLSHTMLNRHYCLYEAPSSFSYSSGLWGLTACYGAGSTPGYSARNPKGDDGVIAPTAALSSYPYTPFYSTQVLMTLDGISECVGEYGLADSYKPSEKVANKNHLAIDQGPIVVMIENYRSGLLWNLFMKNAHVQKALQKAGISKPILNEGFPSIVKDSHTGFADIMAHPDRARYEVEYYVNGQGKAVLKLVSASTNEVIKEMTSDAKTGFNIFAFDDSKITRGRKYILTLESPSGKTYSIDVILH